MDMDNVARYYFRMAEENGHEDAMAFTLEMFEGLSEGQVNYAIQQLGRETSAQVSQ